MTVGRWIAYAVWVLFFGVIAYVSALLLASSLFGVSLCGLWEEPSGSAKGFGDAVGITLASTGLALVAFGPAIGRGSSARLAWLPIVCFALVVVAALIAGAVIGQQPCTEGRNPFDAP